MSSSADSDRSGDDAAQAETEPPGVVASGVGAGADEEFPHAF